MTKLNPSFSRRNLLLRTLQGAGFFLLSGCDKIFDALSQSDKFQSLLELAEHGNRRAFFISFSLSDFFPSLSATCSWC